MSDLLSNNVAALTRQLGIAVDLPLESSRTRPIGANVEIRTSGGWMSLHDRTDPIGEAECWLNEALPGVAPSVLCCLGAGLGYALDVLEARSAPAHVVVVESDPVVARALLIRRDWSSWIDSGRLWLLVGPDYRGATHAARHVKGLKTAPAIVLPAMAEHRSSDVGDARELLARLVFQEDANASARRATAGRYLLNTLVNATRIARESDAGLLAGAFPQIPAVIAAAGPSLDRNVVDFFPFRDRALLIACDTAARPLLLHGIEPHLIVAVDSSYANAAHLVGLPVTRASLVAEGSVHPSAFAAFARRTFFGKVSDHEPWPWLRALGLDRGRLDAWGSVATTAFGLALAAGCDPIVFIGADFAFSFGRPYARGTSLEPQWAVWVSRGTETYESVWDVSRNRWPVTFAPDVHGQPARTAPHLMAFRDWVVEKASTIPTGRRIVNATGAGLLAGGSILQQEIADILATAPAIDADAIVERLTERHQASRDALPGLLDAATDLVAGGQTRTSDTWSAFTDGAISRRAIEAALASPEQEAWAAAHTRFLAAMRTT